MTARAERTVDGRPFASMLPMDVLDSVQAGVMRTVYRRVPLLKSPFDMALYLQLFSMQTPRTVIEIGTKAGGSALWFADLLTAHGVPEPRVVSIDIAAAPTFSDSRVRFLEGDAGALHVVLPASELQGYARPWLVVEDSSHLFADTLAVLEFFHPYLQSNDHIVVEDGILDQFSDPVYGRYEHGPSRALVDFLTRRGDSYSIMTTLCDHYGRNVTWNPNGWLKRL